MSLLCWLNLHKWRYIFKSQTASKIYVTCKCTRCGKAKTLRVLFTE